MILRDFIGNTYIHTNIITPRYDTYIKVRETQGIIRPLLSEQNPHHLGFPSDEGSVGKISIHVKNGKN